MKTTAKRDSVNKMRAHPDSVSRNGRSRLRLPVLSLASLALILSASTILAGSGTWDPNPIDSNWSTPANWSCNCVPNGGFDTATFGVSNITNLILSEEITVFELFFGSTSSAYTISCPPGEFFTVGNGGIVQESETVQKIVAAVDELGNAGGFAILGGSAGSSTIFTAEARTSADGASGYLLFNITASAGSATIINKGGVVSGADGGQTGFFGQATAGNAQITNEAGTVSGAGGLTWFPFLSLDQV